MSEDFCPTCGNPAGAGHTNEECFMTDAEIAERDQLETIRRAESGADRE
jgi:hypothetical protein